MYALNLMRIALELAREDYIYEDVASKFFEHFLYIARAMSDIAGQGIGLWDEQDNFYYSVLNLPNGQNVPLRIRSMVGLIPLFAVEVIEQELMDSMPHFKEPAEAGFWRSGRTWRRWCRAGTSRARRAGACCRWRAPSA